MAWTTPKTWGYEETVTAANLNAQLRDNLNYLKDITDDIYAERMQEITSAASITPAPDTDDTVFVKTLAENTFFNNPYPVVNISIHNKFIIWMKDDGTPRTIGWDTQFRGIVGSLPDVTVSGKWLLLGFMWNKFENYWDLVWYVQE